MGGASVPDGTVIKAIIAGDEYETTTPAAYGPSTYALLMKPLQTYTEGTAITFMIGTHTAAQTSAWERGGNINLNLTATP